MQKTAQSLAEQATAHDLKMALVKYVTKGVHKLSSEEKQLLVANYPHLKRVKEFNQ